MDHHGVLRIVRSIGIQLQNVRREREIDHKWSYVETPVIFPESKCPYCEKVMRSPCIWFFRGLNYNYLVGAMKPEYGRTARLIQPGHPHGTSPICLGRNPDGISMLTNMINIRDCSMPLEMIPEWINRWWDHGCPEMRTYLVRYGYDIAAETVRTT